MANADSGTDMKQETAQPEGLYVRRESQDMMKPSNQHVIERPVADDQPFLLSGWKLQTLIAGLGLSMLLVGLDFTMVATAVPTITTEFNSLQDVSWYGSSFLIAICACQLLTGNLFANFSHKVMFMIYVAIFLVGSIICGVSQSSATLIVGRAVTGIGASGLFGGTLIVISAVVPKPQQPLYLGLVVSVYTSTAVLGPLIGGAFTQHASWRWCFWINLPIGGITLVTLLLFLNSRTHIDEKRSVVTRLRGMDLVGFALFSGAVVQLLLALQWAGFEYPWHSSVIIGLMVGFGVTLIAFIAWQLHLGDKASIPPKLFKKRTVCLGMFIAFFGNGGFFVILYYLQIWFQTVKGASPLKSGIMYLPTVGADISGAVLSGALVSKAPYYNPFLLFGIACLVIGAGLDTTLATNSYAGAWVGFQIFCGFGFALLVQMPIVAVQRELLPTEIPLGTTVIIFGQAFSAGLFVAVGQPVFEATLRPFLLEHVPSVDADKVIAAGASGLHSVAGPEILPLLREAYNHACTRVFYITVGCGLVSFACACGMKWIRLPTPPAGATLDQEQGGGELDVEVKGATQT
ncbi:MFS general substrate transporter [Pleomassaria siparia CBS 279.74]|uniref:MFS general substrate transporter n=1 Tax=Pleomassaria siparia CBS 279.74 TaxID=1314801 RepID=A0A6G1JZT0_9PLEO|nr:MFS general substrate transporter [Pleomassaria siparia CBS 279.74]